MIGSGEVKDKPFDGSANTRHADALAAIRICSASAAGDCASGAPGHHYAKRARGEYPIACVTQWVKHLQDRIKTVGAGAGVVKERREYLAEKTKLVRIQRLEAEHAVIAVADVQEVVARIGLRVRNNALQVPSDTTPLLIMQDGSIIFRVLTDRVYRMLEHLSAPETWTDDLEDHEAGDGDKSAA